MIETFKIWKTFYVADVFSPNLAQKSTSVQCIAASSQTKPTTFYGSETGLT